MNLPAKLGTYQKMNPVLNVGFNNFVLTDQIEAIIDVKTSNSKKLIKETSRIIDCTKNRARQSIIVLTSGAVLLSAIPRLQLKKRLVEPELPPVKKRIKKFHVVKTTDAKSTKQEDSLSSD